MFKVVRAASAVVQRHADGGIPKRLIRFVIGPLEGVRPPCLPPKRRVRSPEQERAVHARIAASLDVPEQDIVEVVEWVATDLRAVAHRTTIFLKGPRVIAIEKAAEKIEPGDLDRP